MARHDAADPRLRGGARPALPQRQNSRRRPRRRVGQQAVAVGAMRALAPGDVVTSSHRPHHHGLARGVEPNAMMAELFGRADGTGGGRCGTMHIAAMDRHYYGGNGIVGAGLGLALGAALAAQVRSSGQVALGFFGDGAAVSIGRVWEADQHGGGVEAAADRLLREQPLRGRDADRERHRRRPRSCAARRASGCRRCRSTGRTRAPSTAPCGRRASARSPARGRPSSRRSPTATRATTPAR